ncbi:hypothetical protein SDC9_46577 [bioreactor metagenome]|uniref:Uncharacterized protein n=1 Tax=bioreactor metagenome TaxID=1076179 RepID=A0A644WCQ7_9ZZZZ
MAVGSEIFCQDSRIGIGIISADDHQCIDAVLFAHGCACFELFQRFQFGPSTPDDVESAGIAVWGKKLTGDDLIGVLQDAGGASLESVEDILGICSLEGVEQAADDIVSSGSLSTTEDDADISLSSNGFVVAFGKGDSAHAIGMREQCLDGISIGRCTGWFSIHGFDAGDILPENCGQFWLVRIANLLQRGNVHNELL